MVLLLNYVSQNKWLAGASEKIKVWVLAQGLSRGLEAIIGIDITSPFAELYLIITEIQLEK